MKNIILASGSQGRKAVLELTGIPFKTVNLNTDESVIINKNYAPKVTVEKLSLLKAEEAIKQLKEDAVVITADTVVCLNNEILLKPKDKKDAFNKIAKLSGTCHLVYTGVCIYEKNSEGLSDKIVFSECTQVFMRKLTCEEIQKYVDSGDPMGKAGSLDIQGKGSVFVKKIVGDYYNIVGLPVCRVYEHLIQLNAV